MIVILTVWAPKNKNKACSAFKSPFVLRTWVRSHIMDSLQEERSQALQEWIQQPDISFDCSYCSGAKTYFG